ncbi:MAG: bifunctional glutamate N-acetyltransferase/amino-acid acetyltransferase ArgJ [Nitrospirae bacterium]|nr:bifunctional glutamate N-acetyltransferase/amino-acid acetyltransferase ArgJ [Nitrospirota bacterium]
MVPKGFLFSAVEAAIKKPGRKDLALIYSEPEAVISGMFTTNRIKAAPVKLDMRRIRTGRGRAIVANSGNANACSGKQGMKDAEETAALVAKGLGLGESAVHVCSTGVIGTPMPMERIRAAIPRLIAGLRKETLLDAAAAIMTTDTFSKVVSRRVKVGNVTGTIAGICKGAGMICPQMATMLCFILTDLSVEKTALDTALKGAVRSSFNRITIDGDMSTNDTVLVMANGKAANETIKEGSPEFSAFATALSRLAFDLARLIAKDGEGATKLIEVEVRNARNQRDADKAAFAIANSLLVKTAVYGNDANWGRIMAALGYARIGLEEERTDVYFGKVKVARNGIATGKDREAAEVLKGKEIRITADLHIGSASSKVLTCDLTEGYVKINAQYRT